MIAAHGRHWYALHVLTNTESLVSKHLEYLDIEQYLPMRRAAKKNDAGPRVLFPGYLFCRVDLRLGPKLYKVPGLQRIVGNGKVPIPIDQEEMDTVRCVVGCAEAVEPLPFLPALKRIRLSAGPFAGRTGMVVRSRGKAQFIVSLSLLQRSLAVTVPLEWIDRDTGSVQQ